MARSNLANVSSSPIQALRNSRAGRVVLVVLAFIGLFALLFAERRYEVGLGNMPCSVTDIEANVKESQARIDRRVLSVTLKCAEAEYSLSRSFMGDVGLSNETWNQLRRGQILYCERRRTPGLLPPWKKMVFLGVCRRPDLIIGK